MKYTKEEIIDFLFDHEVLMAKNIMPHIKATHGSCCTCQDCGYYHDSCVCEHNKLIMAINKRFK